MPAVAAPPIGTCANEHPDREGRYLYELEGSPGVMVCAPCSREASAPYRYKRVQRCDRDPEREGPPTHSAAFRDPSHRKNVYLCIECHKANGYVLSDSSMLSKLDRVSKRHHLGRKEPCIAAGYGTECSGQTKQRSNLGVLCDFHARGGRA